MCTCKSFFLFSLRILSSHWCFGWWWTSDQHSLGKWRNFGKYQMQSCHVTSVVLYFLSVTDLFRAASSEGENSFMVFLCSGGTPCVPVCAHGLLLCHWPPLKRAWLCPLWTFPSGIYAHWWDPLWAFSSPAWTAPDLSACSNRRAAPAPWSSWWPSIGFFPVRPCFSCTWGHRTGHGSPGAASPMLTRGEEAPLLSCWQYFA